jgi:hypothetical protein
MLRSRERDEIMEFLQVGRAEENAPDGSAKTNHGAESQTHIPTEQPVYSESAMGQPNQATRLVELSGTAELFHSPDGTPYATIPVADHFETWGINSAGFKRWLAHKYYRAYGSAPNSQSLHDAVNVISAKAQFDAPEHPVFIRVGGSDEKIYLDLCDDKWRVVEITSEGWQIMHSPPVKFRRASGALPLPVPVQGGKIAELRVFLNLNDDRDYALFFACLVAALRPRGPYPILVVGGEHGSAKSTLARVMRALVDPYKAAIRSAPRAEDDLMVSAGCCHLAVFDNLSRLEDWLSDALCRLATGGGLAKRQLYTDLDQVVLDVQRPVVINSIEDLVTRGDFLDRSVNLRLPPISDEKRQEERTLWDRFDKARPSILGAILTAVSAAIKNLPSVQIKRLPRMADFAVWAVAAEPALGLAKGSFLSAYEQNRARANAVTLESSRIAGPLCRFANAKGSWLGGVQELLEELSKLVSEDERRARHWPGSARGLRAALDRLIPNLRGEGININYPDAKAARTRRALVQIQIANKDSEASDDGGSPKGLKGLKGLKGCSQLESSGQGSIQPGEGEESGDAVVI